MGLQLDGYDAYQDIEEALPQLGRLGVYNLPTIEYKEQEILYKTWWPKNPGPIEIAVRLNRCLCLKLLKFNIIKYRELL